MPQVPSGNFSSPAALARFLVTAAVGLATDLWVKAYAFEALADHHTVKVIDGYLHIQITVNRGAVFGLGPGHRGLFVVVSLGAIVFLSYLFAQSGGRRFYQLVLGLLLAGVLGNLYDRVVFGYVRDMIFALPRWPHVFPYIFNVADILLCTGVGLLLLQMVFAPGPMAVEEGTR